MFVCVCVCGKRCACIAIRLSRDDDVTMVFEYIHVHTHSRHVAQVFLRNSVSAFTGIRAGSLEDDAIIPLRRPMPQVMPQQVSSAQ